MQVPSGLFDLVPSTAKWISSSVTPGTPSTGANVPLEATVVPGAALVSVAAVVSVVAAAVVAADAAVVVGSAASVVTVVAAVASLPPSSELPQADTMAANGKANASRRLVYDRRGLDDMCSPPNRMVWVRRG